MRNWFRIPRSLSRSPQGHRPARKSPPVIESLEDRTVLSAANQAYVTELYQVVLNRAPDAAGLASWTNLLDQNALTPYQVALSFINSPEYHGDEVQGLYQTLLRRAADSQGLSNFVAFLNQGGSARQVEAAILSSDEYFQTQGGGTNAGFLQAIYRDVLNRAPDPSGLQTFTQALNTGVSRAQVVQIILDSPEATTIEVQDLYQRFLNRAPDPSGQAAFQAALQAGQANPSGDPTTTGSASAQPVTTTGSASAQRALQGIALVGLPAGSTIQTGTTIPAGAQIISVPGVTLPTGVFAVLLPGQTLPAGATVVPGLAIPPGSVVVTVPGVTLPTGTEAAALPYIPLNVPGETIGTLSGLPSGTFVVALPGIALPSGATPVPGNTLPAGSVAITVPGVALPGGVFAVATPGNVPAGTVIVPITSGTTSGSASQQRNVTTTGTTTTGTAGPMTMEQAAATMLASPEFFQDAQQRAATP